MHQIDVFGDYLALSGRSEDTTIASGVGSLIALASIEIPDLYYWAKVFSLKSTIGFRGV
jgi:hypothetical protein